MGLIYKNSIIPTKCKYHAPIKGGFYYNNEVFFSKAFQSLSKSGRNLLHCFILERRWHPKTKVITNNGKISFTEIQFKEIYGYSSTTYLKARNHLIKCGLIIQTYKGGFCRGDMATYKILCIEGVLLSEKRWLAYPEKNWAGEIPKLKKQFAGVKTQWKKGQSGRNLKTTLLKDTHNDANDPIKVYPKK